MKKKFTWLLVLCIVMMGIPVHADSQTNTDESAKSEQTISFDNWFEDYSKVDNEESDDEDWDDEDWDDEDWDDEDWDDEDDEDWDVEDETYEEFLSYFDDGELEGIDTDKLEELYNELIEHESAGNDEEADEVWDEIDTLIGYNDFYDEEFDEDEEFEELDLDNLEDLFNQAIELQVAGNTESANELWSQIYEILENYTESDDEDWDDEDFDDEDWDDEDWDDEDWDDEDWDDEDWDDEDWDDEDWDDEDWDDEDYDDEDYDDEDYDDEDSDDDWD